VLGVVTRVLADTERMLLHLKQKAQKKRGSYSCYNKINLQQQKFISEFESDIPSVFRSIMIDLKILHQNCSEQWIPCLSYVWNLFLNHWFSLAFPINCNYQKSDEVQSNDFKRKCSRIYTSAFCLFAITDKQVRWSSWDHSSHLTLNRQGSSAKRQK
jgi:hypothetical protein